MFILLAVQIEASFVSPFPRSKRNHHHCGRFQVSLVFSMASNQTARGIVSDIDGAVRFRDWFQAKALLSTLID